MLSVWLCVRVRQLELALSKAEHLSLTDDLTNLANRRSILNSAKVEMNKAKASNSPLTVAICDIDKFKRINDEHGHDVGDLVLVGVANILQTYIRKTDSIGRIGGEEFAILMPNTDCIEAERVLTRLSDALRSASFTKGLSVTMSVGMSCLESHDHSFLPIIKRADVALYDAKNQGRDTIIKCSKQPS